MNAQFTPAAELRPGMDLVDVNTGEAFARILSNVPADPSDNGSPMVEVTTINKRTGAKCVSRWRAAAKFNAVDAVPESVHSFFEETKHLNPLNASPAIYSNPVCSVYPTDCHKAVGS